MLEEYLNIITNMENYVDGIMVVDERADIVYLNQFRPDFTPLDEKRAIGKNLFELYPDLDESESTILAAIREGKVTMGREDLLTTSYGRRFRVIDNTFPIKEDGKIIGAVSVVTFPEGRTFGSPVEVYGKKDSGQKHLYQVSDMIGRSPVMQAVRSQIQRIAKTSSSVLIYGSTGTGKELAAQSIHTSSNRKNNPFISQNCAAIPATLLESLFFGTAKGSYTGAEDRPGIFESADGGTVFLDEINSMDINLQAKLLRILEERSVTRIGSTESVDVDVRIVAATNRPPVLCMEEGSLRPDLFYRLGSVTVDLPDLKDRPEDIDLLAEYFISAFNDVMHRQIIGVSQEVMTIFKTYSWPGNIREFRNVIEGAFNLCEGNIIAKGDLPSYLVSSLNLEEILPEHGTGENRIQWLGSLKKNMDAYEKMLILDAVENHKNLTETAEYLGITRQALNQKLNKYHIAGH